MYSGYFQVVVFGVGPTQPAGSSSMVRILESQHVFEVSRSCLTPIPKSHIEVAKKAIHEDATYSTICNKPASCSDANIKYWDQRYRIFKRYDDGILLDDEFCYSITFEAIGERIASKSLQSRHCSDYYYCMAPQDHQ